MVLNVPILVILIVIIVVILIIIAVVYYKRVPQNKIMIIYSGGIKQSGSYKIVPGGETVFLMPIIQKAEFLDSQPIDAEHIIEGVLFKNVQHNDIKLNYVTAVSTDRALITNAAERILGLQTNEIISIANDILSGGLRKVMSNLETEEIDNDKERIIHDIYSEVNEDFEKLGLNLISINVKIGDILLSM